MSFVVSDTDSTSNLSNCRVCYLDSSCNFSSPNLRTQFKEAILASTSFNKNNKSLFDGIVVNQLNGDEVRLSDLWTERPIILKVLARLGCAFCKAEARDLSDLKPYFDRLGIGLVAVAFEDVDMMTFISSGYWKWNILIDPERKVYGAAGLHRRSLKQLVDNIITKRSLKLLSYLQKNGIPNSTKGDIRQLGGTFVIDRKGHIIYQFKPSHTSTSPNLRELYKVCGGDPKELDGIKFLTNKFMFTQSENSYLSNSLSSLNKRIKDLYPVNLNRKTYQ